MNHGIGDSFEQRYIVCGERLAVRRNRKGVSNTGGQCSKPLR